MNGPGRITTGPGSRQDYETPAEFIAAFQKRFGPIVFDLAAHSRNTKAKRYFTEREDSLSQSWSEIETGGGWLWLNPPFADIKPWAKKCADEMACGARVAMLVTASVGSNWFRDYVAPWARVYLLNGRICFDGQNVYPKDCLLAVYDGRASMAIWDWVDDKICGNWSWQG